MRSLILIASLLLPCGCNSYDPTKPITNDQLALRSRSAMHHTTVRFPGVQSRSPIPVSQSEMQRLIAALYPIKKVSSKALIGDCFDLAYQAGMSPTSVRVRLDGKDHLVFEWDSIVYIGGAPSAFQSCIDSLRSTEDNGGQQSVERGTDDYVGF
jgi:hypothetical protein